MGCNYYLKYTLPCHCCGRAFDDLHIGKSSAGWYFALHVIPELGVDTLDDWRNLWSAPGAIILDEFYRLVSISDLELIITVRQGKLSRCAVGYASEEELHRVNHSEWGDNYLLRSRLGRGCIGHGEGPWSYFTGDFS